MPSNIIPDAFSRMVRPTLVGQRGAVATAHPLASAAGQLQLATGGSAADAVVAAQAVLSVIAPEACGLGGDGFFLVRSASGEAVAINAAGRSASLISSAAGSDGNTVNVPGMVAGWAELLKRYGRRKWSEVLAPAICLASEGFPVRQQLVRAIAEQRERLLQGGAETWCLLQASDNSRFGPQPQLAQTLLALNDHGADWFYCGPMAAAMCLAVARHGGGLVPGDFAAHQTVICAPVTVSWRDCVIHLQPPMSQGILLGMALKGLENLGEIGLLQHDHAAIELTELAFASRDEVGQGTKLLSKQMDVDLSKAGRRGGPRAYLHTAGTSAADYTGLVVSSLVSVFDDFGSAIFVPEGGFVLNNRGASFTQTPNEIAPAKLPVHTLAPIVIERGNTCVGICTPGADGQIQTLLQVLLRWVLEHCDLDIAINHPRWRSENKRLLIEHSHPHHAMLAKLGHDVARISDGDARFGSIVCAGTIGKSPAAIADWRRESWAGVT